MSCARKTWKVWECRQERGPWADRGILLAALWSSVKITLRKRAVGMLRGRPGNLAQRPFLPRGEASHAAHGSSRIPHISPVFAFPSGNKNVEVGLGICSRVPAQVFEKRWKFGEWLRRACTGGQNECALLGTQHNAESLCSLPHASE